MRKSISTFLIGAAVLSPPAPASAQYTWSVVDAERAAGQQLFADHCMACHGNTGVAKGFAPSLVGIVGRRAGTAAGFSFSPALKNSGIDWSEANLTKWITDPAAMLPGTPMPHVSFKDPAERLFILEYLKTLRR
jgi:cytochrome c